mgnify:CR=1 FL=1
MNTRGKIAVFISCALLSVAGQAGPITWSGSALSGGGPAAVNTAGTLIEAHNAGTGVEALLVGGVAFDTLEPLPLTYGFVGANPLSITGDTNFDKLLNTASYSNNFAVETYAIDGLVTGRKYLIQFFAADSRGCCGLRTVKADDKVGNTLTSTALNAGYVFTGQFTASGATREVSFSAGGAAPTGSNPVAYINAWQLRDVSAPVPVPATLALVCLGLFGLGRSKRKKA